MSKDSARDVRISEISPLRSPDQLSFQLPLSDEDRERIALFRENVNNIISGKDNRLLSIVGPCSIHDPNAAIEYAFLYSQRSRIELDSSLKSNGNFNRHSVYYIPFCR